jgi:hypothetical protein
MRPKHSTIILLQVIIFLFIVHEGCAKNKPFLYRRDGISFTLQTDWKVIANDSIGNTAYYFSAEKTADQATGLITVTWINKIEDPDKMIDIHQKSMKEANIYRSHGIEFTSIGPENFSGIKAKSCQYSTFVNEKKLDGQIYCFNTEQKTITIFFQTGTKDKRVNEKAFDLFKLTFNCRE